MSAILKHSCLQVSFSQFFDSFQTQRSELDKITFSPKLFRQIQFQDLSDVASTATQTYRSSTIVCLKIKTHPLHCLLIRPGQETDAGHIPLIFAIGRLLDFVSTSLPNSKHSAVSMSSVSRKRRSGPRSMKRRENDIYGQRGDHFHGEAWVRLKGCETTKSGWVVRCVGRPARR